MKRKSPPDDTYSALVLLTALFITPNVLARVEELLTMCDVVVIVNFRCMEP